MFASHQGHITGICLQRQAGGTGHAEVNPPPDLLQQPFFGNGTAIGDEAIILRQD
jgi:hypothetical protein